MSMQDKDTRPGSPAGANHESNNDGPRRRGRGIIFFLALLLVAGAASAGYWYWNYRGYISSDDAYVEGDQTDIGAKILGRIVQLSADEGDTVQPGLLLAQLDDSDLRAQETQAQAGLNYAEQNVTLSRVGLERAQEDFDRAALQIRDAIVTQEQYDHSRKALQVTQAQLEVAQAQVQSAQAQLNVVETQLKNTQIVATAPGIVAKKWVVVGDIVQPGQPIITTYDLARLWVRANIEETKIAAIHAGEPVHITVDAYPGHVFSGRVALIGAAAASQFSLIPPNNASGNFTKVTQRVPIKIMLEDLPTPNRKNLPLLPGMSVVIKIRVESR